MENGYFGLVHGDCKDVVASAKEVRNIRNQVLSSLELAAGERSWRHLGISNPMQRNHMHLESLEMVLVTTRDRISYVNIFRMPGSGVKDSL